MICDKRQSFPVLCVRDGQKPLHLSMWHLSTMLQDGGRLQIQNILIRMSDKVAGRFPCPSDSDTFLSSDEYKFIFFIIIFLKASYFKSV